MGLISNYHAALGLVPALALLATACGDDAIPSVPNVSSGTSSTDQGGSDNGETTSVPGQDSGTSPTGQSTTDPSATDDAGTTTADSSDSAGSADSSSSGDGASTTTDMGTTDAESSDDGEATDVGTTEAGGTTDFGSDSDTGGTTDFGSTSDTGGTTDFGSTSDTGTTDFGSTSDTGGTTDFTTSGVIGTSEDDHGPLFDLGEPDVPPEVEPDNPGPRFTEVTVEAGLDGLDPGTLVTTPFCQMQEAGSPPGSGNYCTPERSIGSVAVGDYDADGWPDIYMARIDGPDWLLQNQGDGTFTDVWAGSGIGDHITGGSAWVDVEGDGDLDLLLTVLAENRNFLYLNDGLGNFTEDAIARGFALDTGGVHVGTSIGVGDYDLDGYLDVFVGEWRETDELGPGEDHNRLLHNMGAAMPGHFEDVTAAMGIDLQNIAALYGTNAGAFVFAPAFVDLDGDRWPELALTADWRTSRLYANDTVGGFIDVTDSAMVGTDQAGMGATFADYDGDGDLDWFASSVNWPAFGYTGNRMYRNDGNLVFSDATDTLGVRDAGWGWGASMFDADLDGDVDLAVTGGFHNAMFGGQPSYVWENDGPGPWPDVTVAAGIDFARQGRGLTTIDYDRDGDLDLLIHSNTEMPALYRNDADIGSWLEVRTEGGPGNTEGIGAEVRVQVVDGGPIQVRHIGVSSHYLGQAEAAAYFGLGWGSEPVFQVEVYWPATDTSAVLSDVARDQMVFVEP